MKFKFLAILLLILPIGITTSQTYKQTENGIKSTIQSMQVEIQFFSPSIVRIFKAPSVTSADIKSLSVVKLPEKTNLKITENGKVVSLTSSVLKVNIDLSTGKINYFDTTGKPLFAEKEYGAQFTPTMDVEKLTFIAR